MYEEFLKFSVGDRVLLEVSCSDDALKDAKWASGAGDVIISDGEITAKENWDKALLAANPRTAVGATLDGTLICLYS